MADRDTTKRMFTHMINMMEQHDTMIISCGDPLIELLKDVRELLKEQEAVIRCKDCKNADYGTDEDGNRFMKCIGSVKCYGGTTPDFFCADGIRKSD